MRAWGGSIVLAFSAGLHLYGCSDSERGPSAAASAAPTTTSTPPDAAISDAGTGLDGDAGGFTDEGHCLDDRPAPTLDGGFDGGDDAGRPLCPTTGACVNACNDFVAHYKLGVAQVAVSCLRGLADCGNDLDVRLCGQNALMQACKDPSAQTTCKALVIPCDPNAGGMGSLIDENGCEGIVRGLGPAGRSTFSSCIQAKIDAGTCPTEVNDCSDAIAR